MEWVEGRSVPDAWPNAYHDGWFLDAGADTQRAVWDSFHDALAAVHRVDLDAVATAYDGPRGAVAVLDYWREALLDLVEPSAAPRHLAVFDWLAANIPPSADAPPALCMGDARLVNAIVDAAEVAALVDFEVAYVGNPTADVAYSLFLERSHGHTAPLPGLPSEEETWARWSAATGRELVDLDYWMAFGATIIVVTATPCERDVGTAGFVLGGPPGAPPALGVGRRAGSHVSADEQVHPFDPAVWSWNESWYFSWIDLDGGPAGFFRLGLLPNQERALIWSYVFHDGTWFGTEETRLRYDDFDLADGMAYDRFGLDFAWRGSTGPEVRQASRRPSRTTGSCARSRVRARAGSCRSRSIQRRHRRPRSTAPALATTWAASSTRPAGSSSRWPSPAPCASETRRGRCEPPATATGRGVRATGE